MRICLFGLGEAGALLASDLVASGADVQAYDPADVATPEGVVRYRHPALAVGKTEAVLAVTAESDAKLALLQALEAVPADAVYADLSTAAPALKLELAAIADSKTLPFADVALMGMVAGHGLATPSLAAGTGASRYAELVNGHGGRVEVAEGGAGSASAKKLLRSVMMKGTAAVLIEALRAGAAADDLEWLWVNLTAEIEAADEAWLHRLVSGTKAHAGRRLDELRAARDLLGRLGVDGPMTTATIETLRALVDGDDDVPTPPSQSG